MPFMSSVNSYNIAVIFLHPACNMTCTFCITEDNFDLMTPVQALDLLNMLKKENFKSIVFGGGEPFEWPGDLLSLAQDAKRLGFFVQVGTNAVALPTDFQNIKSIDRYVLPLESSLGAVHNKMRVFKQKHHQLVLDALRLLQAARKSVTLSTIITSVNKDGIRTLALFLKELDRPLPFIHAWHLYKFIPQGRGGSVNAADLMVPDLEYKKIIDEVKAMGLPFKVYQREDMYHSYTVDFFWYEHGRLRRGSKG